MIPLINCNSSHSKKGQSLVELALTLTLLLVLLAGAFDLGSAFLDYIAIRDAAQEGVLYGSTGLAFAPGTNTDAGVNAQVLAHQTNTINRVKYSSNKPLDMTETTVTVSFSRGVPPGGVVMNSPFTLQYYPCTGDYIIVTVSYDYSLTTPFVGALLNGSSPISNPIHLTAPVTNVIMKPECP